ncbi:reverse transcriptase domain-containing protein [Tanacetum coccineum]
MADNRTMAQMLQAPIEGYEDAIVVPPINANNFELKQPLINLVQSNKFTGRQDPHNHLRFFNKVTSTFRHPEVPNTSIKLLLFPFSLDGEARDWLDKEPPRSILTWDDLVSKFINQFFPPNSLSNLRNNLPFENKITTFDQGTKPNVPSMKHGNVQRIFIVNVPHHYSAAGGNFLDKMPREGLAIIESKSKVRYSRSRPNDSRAITNAPSSTSSPSNNSFEIQQMVALLEDKMNIRMSRLEKAISEKNVTTPATVKAVEEVCVTCGSNNLSQQKSLLLFKGLVWESFEIFGYKACMEIPKPKAKKTVNVEIQDLNSPRPNSCSNNPLGIWIERSLSKVPKFNKWLSSLLRNKEKLEEIAITTKHGLEALTPTRMTFELANRSITHPMGIAEDVVVRVDFFTFLADFVVVNFEPDPRVPIILGRPFLRAAKALIDLYEEKLTLRVGKEELVYYADKSEKNKSKHCVHAISIIDFSKDDPFSGSTTTHSDDPSPSSSLVKTSDNFKKFADELATLDSLPPGNDDSTLKKDLHEENFQDHSNPLFEFDDNFKSSTINPLFDEIEEDVECFAPEDNDDEIDAFLAMEVSSNFEEGYFDSEGDVIFLDNLLSDDVSHNLVSEVEQNESSITFSPRSDPLHHEFVGELLTLPSRNDREFEEYLSLMIVLCEISTSQDSEPAQEEIDIFLVPDDLIPPGVENDDSKDKVNESPNLDHQDDPSIPRTPPEPLDVEKCFEPEAGILITKVFKCVSKSHDFMADILPTLPTLVSYLTFILFLSSFLSFGSEDTVFDPGIVTFHTPVAVSMKVSCSKIDPTISEASRVRYCNPIDAFLDIEVSSNFEEGYFDSEGDVTFFDNLLSDDTTHNLIFEVISDHEPEQNEYSITFSPKSDPLHHEFADELLTLPSRNDLIESLPVSPIPVKDSEPHSSRELICFLVPDELNSPRIDPPISEASRVRFAKVYEAVSSDVHASRLLFFGWGVKKPSNTPDDGGMYGYIKNHKKTVKNGQARTRERKSAQKPEAKPRKVKTSVKHHVRARKAHKDVGFALNTLTQQAQMSLKRIASLAIRVRLFSDPMAQNVDPMIGKIKGMRLRGACRDSRA